MPDRKNYFFVDNGKGQRTKYRGLFSYHSDDFERDYIFYTDDIKDKKGKFNVYASIYQPGEEILTLTEIEGDEEWQMLMQVFREANRA